MHSWRETLTFQVKREGVLRLFSFLPCFLGDLIPPTPAKELSAACTTPILAMKSNVLLHADCSCETHPAWSPPT